MIYLFLFIHLLLGIHSVYYFIKTCTREEDVTITHLPILLVCFLVPIVSHIATFIIYDNFGEKVIFPKKKG